MILRIIGGFFLVLAFIAIGIDLWRFFSTGNFLPTPLGTAWYNWHSDSLGLLQAVIQRYIWPPLWDPGMTTVLLLPVWVLPSTFGGLIWLAGATRKVQSSYGFK